jgi:hypothetical protein
MVFKKMRRAARRTYGRARRYSHSNKGLNPMEMAIGSAAYGVIRPTIANAIPDIQQLGGYSDNVILGGAAALAAWKGKGLIKKAGMIFLGNEAFIASSKAAQGMTSGSAASSGIYIN